MKDIIKYISTVVLFLFNTNSIATEKQTIKDKYSSIKYSIEQKIPEVKVDFIGSSEIPGLLQVNSGAEVFYISDDGSYLVYGEMIDISKPKNKLYVTEEYRKQARVKIVDGLSKNSMIIFSPPKDQPTKAYVTVFTDIDCSYCRKMHRNIPEINKLGIEVRYLSFPRTGPNSASFTKANNIWCAKDKKLAMSQAKQGKTIDKANCDSPVQEHFDLGIMLGIRGTPTIIFADGTILPSYLETEKFAELAIKHNKK